MKARTKGARLVTFANVFADNALYQKTWQERLAEFSGAVVIASRRAGCQWVGHVAAREASHLTDLDKLVFLLGTSGLIPWASVTLSQPESHPPALPLLVEDPPAKVSA